MNTFRTADSNPSEVPADCKKKRSIEMKTGYDEKKRLFRSILGRATILTCLVALLAFLTGTAVSAETQQYDGCGGDHVQYVTGSGSGSQFTFLVNGVPWGSFNYEIYYRKSASGSWIFLDSDSSSIGLDPQWTYDNIYPGYQIKIITYSSSWAVKDVHIWVVKDVTCTVSSKSVAYSSGSFSIGGNANTSYIISDDASWLSVSPSSGSAGVNGATWASTVSYNANSSASSRTATISIMGGSVSRHVTVTQAEAPHALSVSKTSVSLLSGGGSDTVTVTANVAWNYAYPIDWLTVSNSGNTLVISATANTTTSTRSAEITVFDADWCQNKTIAVTQAPSPTYTLTVNSAGASSVAITSSTGHGGTTNYTKRSLTSGTSVTLTAPTVTGYTFTGWTGAVTSSSSTINLTMSPDKTVTANFTAHALSVSKTSVSLSSEGGSDTVTVTANVAWNYAYPIDWLTVNNSGNTLVISATANTTTSTRSAEITVFDADWCQNKTIAVTQAKPNTPIYSLTVNSAGASSVAITSSTGHGGTTNYAKTGLASGTSVNLTAPTLSGYAFTGWTGALTSSSSTINLTMNPDKAVTANYVQNPDQIIATHSSTGYQAGGACQVQCRIEYTVKPGSMTWQATLPVGWSYASDTSTASSKPSVGQTGIIAWVWTSVPASPVTFSFTANVPAGEIGAKNLAAKVIAFYGDVLSEPAATPNPLVINPVSLYHSADYNHDFRIDDTEITRAISLYTKMNGTVRTGDYYEKSGTVDGYSTTPGTRIGSYHSADYARSWQIDDTEVTRLISLYTYTNGSVRTGEYHAQSGTVDGFSRGRNAVSAVARGAIQNVMTVGETAVTPVIEGTHSAGNYQAGGTCQVQCRIEYTVTPGSLTWQASLPAGWSYASDTSTAGSKPSVGQTGIIAWVWMSVPVSPVTFSFTANVPAGESGAKNLAAKVIAFYGDVLNEPAATPNPLVIGDSNQSITFPALPAKTYGDADFAPGATASSGLAVTYTSSNAAVATIVAGNVHIVGAGTATITASQPGNGSWNAATPVAQTLTVAKKALTATAENKTRSVGQANPAFTIAYTGFVNGDTAAVLDTPPAALCSATATSAAGTYPITVSGGSDANYAFSYVAGTLTITPVDTVTVSVSATPANGGTVGGGGTKNSGSSFTVTATATSGYKFTKWTVNGAQVSTSASYTFTPTSSRNLVANFTDAPPAPLYTVSTAFAGTVTVKSNWVDFSGLDEDDTNCNDWVAFPVTYNAYLVLCYGEILCPVCPFPITDAWLWLVDKKGKQLFTASVEDGGITDAQGYCFGNGNVGVTFATFLPYADLEGLTEFSYTTSPAVTFTLAGGREKANSKAAANILKLEGGATLFEISPTANNDKLAALECEDASEAAVVTASFKKSGARVKPDPYCPECATSCESVYAAQLAAVVKAAKKSFWWDILGEGDVEPTLK